MKIEVRPFEPDDVMKVVASMRDEDVKAVLRFGDPVYHISKTARMAQLALVGLIEDEIACAVFIDETSVMFGGAHVGVITTSVADEHPRVFGRHTKWMFEELRKDYPEMWGEILPGYERSRKWLAWLGFEIEGDKFRLRRN